MGYVGSLRHTPDSLLSGAQVNAARLRHGAPLDVLAPTPCPPLVCRAPFPPPSRQRSSNAMRLSMGLDKARAHPTTP